MRRIRFIILSILIIITSIPLVYITVKNINWRSQGRRHSLSTTDARYIVVPDHNASDLDPGYDPGDGVSGHHPQHKYNIEERKNKDSKNFPIRKYNKNHERIHKYNDEAENKYKEDHLNQDDETIKTSKQNAPNNKDEPPRGLKNLNKDKMCSFMKTYSSRMKRRRAHLINECSLKQPSIVTGNNLRSVFKNILICDEHKLLICTIPKAGSTFLKKVIYMMSEEGKSNMKESKSYIFKKLSNLNYSDAIEKLRTYTKAIFTRDPMGRFFSAYSNKFVTVNPPYWAYGRRIINQMRHNPDIISQRCGHNITFEEFLQFIISEHQNLEDNPSYIMDQHWLPMTRSCDPCHIDYDIIGKLSSFNDDILYMLCTLGAQKKVQLPNKDSLDVRKHIMELEIQNSFKGWRDKLSERKCMTKTELPKRIVSNLYQHGYLEYIPDTMEEEVVDFNKEELTQYIMKLVDKSSTETLLKLPDIKKEEAYRHIPQRLIQLLKDTFSDDFSLFGNSIQ